LNLSLLPVYSRSIPDLVNELLPREGSQPKHLLEALDFVADRAGLSAWLQAIADDPESVAQIAKRSYWHVNGFAKLMLHRASRFGIRLHVWPVRSGRLGETNPHSHRWDFASTVVAGDGLVIAEFVEADDGPKYVRHSYGGGDLDPEVAVHLSQFDRRTVLTSERYTTDISVVHTVEPLGASLVATFIVQGPHRTTSTAVYRHHEAPAEPPNRQRTTTMLEVQSLVSEVLAGLEERGDLSC
jgi:hypothetical protein